MSFSLRINDHTGAISEFSLVAPCDVGREAGDLVLGDPSVSRRHVRLEPRRADGVVVTDLGSSHGTYVNGHRLTGPVLASPGDSIVIGDCRLDIFDTAAAATDEARMTAAPRAHQVTEPQWEQLAGRSIVVQYPPGSEVESIAADYLARAERARTDLRGFGTESMGAVATIRLIGPYPDPTQQGVVVTAGTVVDAPNNTIWLVATAEAPPEEPGRPLAVLFAAGLPAASELAPLIEAYGAALSADETIDRQLAARALPSYEAADPALGRLMAISFIRHLVAVHGDHSVRRLFAEARPDDIDGSARGVLGLDLDEAELAWRQHLAQTSTVSTASFLRIAARYLRPHTRRQAEIFVYMLAGLAFTVAFPFASKRLFDTAIPSGEMSEVLSLLGVLAVALAVTLVASVRRTYLSAYVSGAVIRDLRCEMFDRLQALSAGWYHRRDQGDVLGRLFNDVGHVESGLSNVLREGLFQLLTFVVSVVVMLMLDFRLGLVVLAVVPFVVAVYKLMGSGARSRSVAVQEETGAVISVAAENYEAEQVVKAFGLSDLENVRFRAASEKLFAAERRLVLFTSFFGLSVNLIVTLLRMVVLGFGAWLIFEGHLTIGGLVAFLGVMGSVLDPVTQLTAVGQELQTATGALERVNEIIEEVPELVSPPDARPWTGLRQQLELRDVGFHYGEERPVLEQVSVTVAAGTRVAFVGPSGSGKSTALRLLMRLWDPTIGSVTVDGADLRSLDLHGLRRAMGIVLQDSFLFNTSVAENIRLGRPNATDAEIESAARGAEIHDAIMSMPEQYQTVVGERGAMLSGGQRQRVAIARALIREPDLLLLDEATSALDPRTERQIMDTLRRVGEGRTTIAVTHRLASIADYDQIVVLKDGRVVEQGSHDDLIGAAGVYADLWAEQTGERRVAPAIDAVRALERVSPFSALAHDKIAELAELLSPTSVEPGEVIESRPGRIHVVSSGHFEVVSQGPLGEAVVTTIGPGDVYGVASLLGDATPTRLRATGRGVLLRLAEGAVAAALATLPDLSDAVSGQGAMVRPEQGQRLERPSLIGSVPGRSAVVVPPNRDQITDEIRRTSTSLRWPGS